MVFYEGNFVGATVKIMRASILQIIPGRGLNCTVKSILKYMLNHIVKYIPKTTTGHGLRTILRFILL